MARRRRLLAGLVLAVAVVALPLACNAVTGASGYSTQSCDECLAGNCKAELTECDKDPSCASFHQCLANCDQGSSDLHSCFASCRSKSHATSLRAIQVSACTSSRCGAYCFGGGTDDGGSADATDGSAADATDGSAADATDGSAADVVDTSPAETLADTSIADSRPDVADVGGISLAPKVQPPACDSKGRGPAMVKIASTSGDYCIDTTEVTAAQYFAFWKEAGDGRAVGGQTLACNFNSDYTPQYPSSGWSDPLPTGLAAQPVRYVDWCDAFQFCKWAGKRLCGNITIGSIGYRSADENDVSKDQWYAACSNGGTTTYPYGAGYVGGNCNEGNLGGAPKDIGTSLACKGTAPPYNSVVDMIGNVAEWEDSCEAAIGPTAQCRTRGGNFASSPAGAATCAVSGSGTFGLRGNASLSVGFRCCSPT